MPAKVPHVVALAGPNGAGKSTAAPKLLQEIEVDETPGGSAGAPGDSPGAAESKP